MLFVCDISIALAKSSLEWFYYKMVKTSSFVVSNADITKIIFKEESSLKYFSYLIMCYTLIVES